MKARLLGLLLACLLACDAAPPTPPPSASLGPAQGWKRVQGPGWTLDLPETWREVAPATYLGPDRANISVEVEPVAQPLDALIQPVKDDLDRVHGGIEVLREHRGRLKQLDAWELHLRFQSHGQSVTSHTLILDDGPHKYTLTAAVLTQHYPENETTFRSIFHSFSKL